MYSYFLFFFNRRFLRTVFSFVIRTFGFLHLFLVFRFRLFSVHMLSFFRFSARQVSPFLPCMTATNLLSFSSFQICFLSSALPPQIFFTSYTILSISLRKTIFVCLLFLHFDSTSFCFLAYTFLGTFRFLLLFSRTIWNFLFPSFCEISFSLIVLQFECFKITFSCNISNLSCFLPFL